MLQIYEDHRAIGKYCGSSTPSTVTTEANVLYVNFVSDHVNTAQGFQANYIQAKGKTNKIA